MSDKEQILREAGFLFDEDVLRELKDWYTYTLQGKWRYVVFTVRRSYMMALIFEIITGQKMDTEYVEFLTDASLFLRCSELADAYRDFRRFPKILLSDDIMIHGRNTNHIIEGIQEELCRMLSDEYEKDEIEAALVKAIDIHVYTRTWDQLLLHGEYEWKLHCQREGQESPAFWRQISSDISSLILRSDIANACYIYTEHLSDTKMENIENDLTGEGGFVYTEYQKIRQYTKFIYIGSDDEVKAVLSLRILKSDYHDGYRVVPFAFLPNMDAEETEILFSMILDKVPEKYRDWFLGWKNMEGKRTFNEIITLLLSDAMLKAFNREYEITVEAEGKERELIKLARNYNQYGLEQTRQMLEEFLGRDWESVFSVDDIKKMIEQVVSGERLVMKLETTEEGDITDTEKFRIRERVEDYFYDRGWTDEQAAYELMQLPYFQTQERSKRRARGCCFTLKELNTGYTREESRYCLAYFLQMIDAGIGSLSSYAPNHVRVIGYAQFAKAGELSLLIEPLRMYAFIPMLARMQVECDRRLRELPDEIREFGDRMGWDQSVIKMLLDFVGKLRQIGHTPEDWDGNYIFKVDFPPKNLVRLMETQSVLRQDYVDYAKEKYNKK